LKVQSYIKSDGYFDKFDQLRQQSSDYFKEKNSNYFNDLILIHNFLGLTFSYGDAVVLFPLTPLKDAEYLIISESFNDDVVYLFYALLKVYTNHLNILPFSSSINYPQIQQNDDTKMPFYLRMIPRKGNGGVQSDFSSYELMGVSCFFFNSIFVFVLKFNFVVFVFVN
jgi:hypothetical protein